MVVFMVSPESTRYYAQFMPTKSTVRYVILLIKWRSPYTFDGYVF